MTVEENDSSNERRKYNRLSTNIQATLIVTKNEGPPLVWTGRIINLSRSGALIESTHLLAPQTNLTLIFKNKNESLKVLAEVKHSSLKGRLKLALLGVRFRSVSHVSMDNHVTQEQETQK